MFPARRSNSPSDSAPPVSGGSNVAYLRMVETDRYGDWESVYRDNVDRLYRLIYARVGNRPDAEDLTSEVFRTTLGPLRLSASKGEVRSYLLHTAQTVLASHWRRSLGHPVTSIDPVTDAAYLTDESGPPAHSDAPLKAEKILNALPDRYRRILELRFLEANTIKEAASTMRISVSNAKVLQHRALRMAANVSEELEL
jgi:RNA polymerase sigma factor (sigma-70 family)